MENKTKSNTPSIPVLPSVNVIVVERILIKSEVEKSMRSKAPNLIMSNADILKVNQDKFDSTKNVLDVWHEHPLQGIIVAISNKTADETGYSVGDHIAWRHDESIGMLIVFGKKKYIGLYPHDILLKYLTNKT